GSRYTLFRCMSPAGGKTAAQTIGTQHFIVGIAEIIRNLEDMVTARVVKSFRPIAAGDLLMPEIQTSDTFPLKPGNPNIEGTLIGPEEHLMLMGDGAIVFIDKGRADHVEVGQAYLLFREAMLAESIVSPPVTVGKILVLHTEETTSTAVITRAFVDIQRGERFRAVIGQSH
ncbi:hypothetical protein LJC41_09230, partial [Desulfosarcina sp. OttesenSCG-928-G17]|nr:hypothetical protein [Desulfosarcina sp. OttesenSCG-928-G17]